MNEQKMRDWIDNASYEELLRKWRYAPIGSPWFAGELGDHYAIVMKKKREQVGHAEAVATSKRIDS